MESQPQNPEFRNNPENFHPCRMWKRLILKDSDLENLVQIIKIKPILCCFTMIQYTSLAKIHHVDLARDNMKRFSGQNLTFQSAGVTLKMK